MDINQDDYDCADCLLEAVAKQQLLADLDAYKMWVEEEDWDKAEDAALNCYEILRAFLDEDLYKWKKANAVLVKTIYENGDN